MSVTLGYSKRQTQLPYDSVPLLQAPCRRTSKTPGFKNTYKIAAQTISRIDDAVLKTYIKISAFDNAAAELTAKAVHRVKTRTPELFKKGDELRNLSSATKLTDIFCNTGLSVASCILNKDYVRAAKQIVNGGLLVVGLYSNQDSTPPVGKTPFRIWKSAATNPDSPGFFGTSIGLPLAIPGHISEVYFAISRPGQWWQLPEMLLGMAGEAIGVRFLLKWRRELLGLNETQREKSAFMLAMKQTVENTRTLARPLKTAGAFVWTHGDQFKLTQPLTMGCRYWGEEFRQLELGKKLNAVTQSQNTGFYISASFNALRLGESIQVCVCQNGYTGAWMIASSMLNIGLMTGGFALQKMIYNKSMNQEYFFMPAVRGMKKVSSSTHAILSNMKSSMNELSARRKQQTDEPHAQNLNRPPDQTPADPRALNPIMLL